MTSYGIDNHRNHIGHHMNHVGNHMNHVGNHMHHQEVVEIMNEIS